MPSTAIAVPAGNGSAIVQQEATMASVEARSTAPDSAEMERPRESTPWRITKLPQSAAVDRGADNVLAATAASAPMPVEQLESVLEMAGLTLVQTAPAKLEDTRARMASRAPHSAGSRESALSCRRSTTGPLLQVETRADAGPIVSGRERAARVLGHVPRCAMAGRPRR